MQLTKLIAKMPYLLYVTVLQLGMYACLIVIFSVIYGLGPLFRPRFWIAALPVLLFLLLYVLVRGVLSLRAKGLNYFATAGEFDALTRRDQ
jgi:hypothetical protein